MSWLLVCQFATTGADLRRGTPRKANRAVTELHVKTGVGPTLVGISRGSSGENRKLKCKGVPFRNLNEGIRATGCGSLVSALTGPLLQIVLQPKRLPFCIGSRNS
jgi:hypothetical protein